MKILVCGGRNYGHVVRTKATTEEEKAYVKERIKEYEYIRKVLHHAVMAFSALRNDDDNWLPTDIIIIEGGATGADSVAADFAIIDFCQLEEYPADWTNLGRKAGPIRNQQMLDQGKPDLVIAFPGGKGTANMVALAKAAGVKVVECDGATIPTFQKEN